jgi:hypothetical protein
MDGITGVLYKVPSGEPVEIPKRHLAAFGVTRDSGKTTFVESAVDASGLKAIVFRTKRGELGFENAKPLPLFFDERGLTHWKALEGLIASTLDEKVQREPGVRYAIMTLCKEPTQAKTLEEVYARAVERLKEPKIREWNKEVYTKVKNYLEEVLPQLDKLRGRFTDRLELPEIGVYVEDLIGLSDELQNLFVASLIRKVYQELSGVIVVVAEIWKFLPQDRGSPVKWVIEKFVREMGVVEGWLWLDAQDLRGVDKKHLRSFDVRLFGRQPDPHEIDDILKALPLPKDQKPKPEQIMTLKLGHFYAKLKDDVDLVYVRPVWLPEEVAVRVAKGELAADSDEVQRFKPKSKSLEEVNDEVYKARCEELEKKNEGLQGKVKELETYVEKLASGEAAEKLEKELRCSLEEEKQKNKEIGEAKEAQSKEIQSLKDWRTGIEKKLDAIDKVSEGLAIILGNSTPTQLPADNQVPTRISVGVQQPTLNVVKLTPDLILEQTDLRGRIAIVYAEGLLPENKAFSTRQLHEIMERRFGRKEAYANFPGPLNDFVAWGYFEKAKAGGRWDYRVRIPAEKAKEKGLVKEVKVA